MIPEPAPVPMRRCPRCGHPTRADRMVKGFGRDCATLLGLTGSTVDTGHTGPDLLDVLAGLGGDHPESDHPESDHPESDEAADGCDGWDREWRRGSMPAPVTRRPA